MANHDDLQDMEMDDYFEDGALRESDPPKPQKNLTEKRKQRAARGKRFLILLCIVLALGLVIGISVYVSKRRNDGMRHAEKLSFSLGATLDSAEKNASLTLVEKSEYASLFSMVQGSAGIVESRKDTEVMGVQLPQWLIVTQVEDGMLSEVTYYNFELLEKQPCGTARKAYLDPQALQSIPEIEQLEAQLGLEPYCVRYDAEKRQYREYRYCYEDGETENITAYRIKVMWNADGTVQSIADERIDFIGTFLRIAEPVTSGNELS